MKETIDRNTAINAISEYFSGEFGKLPGKEYQGKTYYDSRLYGELYTYRKDLVRMINGLPPANDADNINTQTIINIVADYFLDIIDSIPKELDDTGTETYSDMRKAKYCLLHRLNVMNIIAKIAEEKNNDMRNNGGL